MARCSSCSAPLPANSSFCSYCGTRNDLDLQAMRLFAEKRGVSKRHCPDCAALMETIHLSDNGTFAVERCPDCFGLFFDPGEVQAFLDASVTPAYVINYQEIASINRERANAGRPIRYLKCPECGKFMNRVNFGANSGVVIDQCKEHGVWLDNGELIHLMEWKRAGGQRLGEERHQQRREEPAGSPKSPRSFAQPGDDESLPDDDPVNKLFHSVFGLLNRLLG